MKTFKLKAVKVLSFVDKKVNKKNINFIDGLIINREDYDNSWLAEIYLPKDELDYFRQLQQADDELFIQVKITKETNEPATLLTKVIGMNLFEDEMNVLFMGSMITGRYTDIQSKMDEAIQNGETTTDIMNKFKAMI